MAFVKGQSGNPKGRTPGLPNKATRELKEIAGEYTEEAISGLVKILRSSDSDSAKVSAAKEILDRSHGKAPQALTGQGGGPVLLQVLSGVDRDADFNS